MAFHGDKPIVLVKIKDTNDIHVVADSVKAYEFFRTKNIYIDLVILNEEGAMYEQYVKYEIENSILNRQLDFLRNNGIYVINLNDITKEDLHLLEFRSDLLLNGSHGNIETQIEDLEGEYLEHIPNIGDDCIEIHDCVRI